MKWEKEGFGSTLNKREFELPNATVVSYSIGAVDAIRARLDAATLEKLERYAASLFEQAYSYISAIGPIPLSKDFLVELSSRRKHGAQGALVRLSSDELLAAVTREEDPEVQDAERSKVVHELLHNFFDEELYPMFVELIYLREKSNSRFDRIEEAYRTGEFNTPKDRPYIDGLESIRRVLGAETIEAAFSALRSESLESLKNAFLNALLANLRREEIIPTEIPH